MEKTGMIGVDPGKRSSQLRGVREDGTAIFRKKVSRERFLAEVSERGPRIVAMEACGSARHRGREPINRTHLTLRSVLWRPAAGWPKAPPNPTIRESAVEAPDSRGRIGNRSSESLSSGLRGRSSCRGCSETEP